MVETHAHCKRCGERRAYLCLRCQGELEQSLMDASDKRAEALRTQIKGLRQVLSTLLAWANIQDHHSVQIRDKALAMLKEQET